MEIALNQVERDQGKETLLLRERNLSKILWFKVSIMLNSLIQWFYLFFKCFFSIFSRFFLVPYDSSSYRLVAIVGLQIHKSTFFESIHYILSKCIRYFRKSKCKRGSVDCPTAFCTKASKRTELRTCRMRCLQNINLAVFVA